MKGKEIGRSAGILMPVFSLPSKYGIGCFSKEAYDFVDFLAEAGQSLWQILPQRLLYVVILLRWECRRNMNLFGYVRLLIVNPLHMCLHHRFMLRVLLFGPISLLRYVCCRLYRVIFNGKTTALGCKIRYFSSTNLNTYTAMSHINLCMKFNIG